MAKKTKKANKSPAKKKVKKVTAKKIVKSTKATKPKKTTRKSTAKKAQRLSQGRKVLLVEWNHSTDVEFETAEAAAAFEKRPVVELEFDIGQCSDENKTLKVKPLAKFPAKLKANEHFSVYREKNICRIEPRFTFKVEIDASKSDEEFNDWALYEGGLYCFRIELLNEGIVEYGGGGQTSLGTDNIYGVPLNKKRS